MNIERCGFGAIEAHNGMERSTLNCMLDNIAKLQETHASITYLEIGVLLGGTFRNILPVIRKDDQAIGVDLFELFPQYTLKQTHGGNYCTREDLVKFLVDMGLHNFILKCGDSKEVIPTLDPIPVGYAFIDANHTFEACGDDVLAVDKILQKGIIHLHDTNIRYGGPLKVVDEVISLLGWKLQRKLGVSHIFEKNMK